MPICEISLKILSIGMLRRTSGALQLDKLNQFCFLYIYNEKMVWA